ncbi:alpha-amylase family glycosyl hydrolase [soil metagenome]
MKRQIWAGLLALVISGAFASQSFAVEPATTVKSPSEPWWKHAIIYEIYPRSFADSNNDGTGDIKGITSKLDYLKGLGVDALWITPCYPSPQVDFGYDIANYCAIAPEYGTLADFDELVAEAKKRNIKIIMDLVMNHTSDKHPWFVESSSSKDNPKRDWYIWRDGGGETTPPNNWTSIFGRSAWKFDAKTNQYYYHFFYPEQPDLNWRNPEVRKAMYDVAKFWLDRGVAGFRLDAITTLFEEPDLPDNPVLAGKNKFGDPNTDWIHNDRLPEVHDVLRELRKVFDSYPDDRVIVGETGGRDINDLCLMYGKNLDEIQLPMNFFFAYINKLSPSEFRARIGEWDKNPSGGWPVYLFSNHDQIRHYGRYGDKVHNDEIAKLTATMLLTLRGTPLLYYGEELGMENNDPKTKEAVQDPIGKLGWPEEIGRDGERTPMQWNAAENAGFTTAAKAWLPSPDSYKTHNVVAEEADKNSVLNFYKELIRLRRTEDALINGDYKAVDDQNKDVLSYVRRGEKKSILVALNMSPESKTVQYDLKPFGINSTSAKTLLASPKGNNNASLSHLTLLPYGVYVGQVQ